jgi:hypothetical protein
MIMTHGRSADIVPEIGTALGFESGKSWSEDWKGRERGRAKVYKTLP